MIAKGKQVKGLYRDHEFTGTVLSVRGNTVEANRAIVTVVLACPIVVYGSSRDVVAVDVSAATWNDEEQGNKIEEIE